MGERRVVVTGVGTINALGNNVHEFWSGCLEGNTSVSPIPESWRRYSQFNSSYWSPLPEIDFEGFDLNKNEIRQNDVSGLLAAVAAREALANSSVEMDVVDGKLNTLQIRGVDSYRSGVYIGTGQGGISSAMENYSYQILARSKKRITELRDSLDGDSEEVLAQILNDMRHPLRMNFFAVGMSMPNSPAANLGIKYSMKGSNETVAAACASGTMAIGRAFREIQNGRVDFAISGGTDYLNDGYGCAFRAFDTPKALTSSREAPEKVNRPFDANRSGFLFSEGAAGVLILEELEHARKRGAPILSEVIGYGESFDAYSIMIPEPDGTEIRALMKKILNGSDVATGEIDYINSHGTGTLKNDPIEAQAIFDLFGRTPAVNSTKSLLGHTIGASGAIEAIVSIKSIETQKVHVSLNLDDPIMDLNFATDTRSVAVEKVLSLSYAFGGHNSGLLFSRLER